MVNFTNEHLTRLKELACKMLFENGEIQNSIGTPLSITELLHTTTINKLTKIKNMLQKQIQNLGNEWVGPDSEKLLKLQENKELVNLIIGYKYKSNEVSENDRKKEELSAKLQELKESQKTPEDRIKELEAELASL